MIFPSLSFFINFLMAMAYFSHTYSVINGGSARIKSKQLLYFSGIYSGLLKSYLKQFGFLFPNFQSSFTPINANKYIEYVIPFLKVGILYGVIDAGCRQEASCFAFFGLICQERYRLLRIPVLIQIRILFVLYEKALRLFVHLRYNNLEFEFIQIDLPLNK